MSGIFGEPEEISTELTPQEKLEGVEFKLKLLEESIIRKDKQLTQYRERLMRVYDGHIHARYDACDLECPRYNK